MRVKCVSNTGETLDEGMLRLGYTRSTHFPLDVGSLYTVYAMALWRGRLVCLVVEEGGRPGWNPVEIFSVEDSRVPASWHFRILPTNSSVQAIWGYAEIACDEAHYEALIDREPRALAMFAERKAQLDAGSDG